MNLITNIFKFITNILESFKANKERYAARKLSAFAGVSTGVLISIEKTNETNLIYVLSAWLIFSLLLLGIVTAEQIIRLKSGLPLDDKKPI